MTAVTTLLLASVLAAGEAPDVRVVVDPRIELMSVIFRLAGNPEYREGRVPAYTADVDAHFGPFRDHEVVKLARELRASRGISYDAVMSLAVHVTDAKCLDEAVPFDPRPESLESRWTTADARRFLVAARDFAKQSDFAAFFEEHGKLYATAVSRMEELIGTDAGFDWFERFFGARPGARFTLALGVLNGGRCYSVRVRKGPDEEDLWCVLGVWAVDGEGLPRFDRTMLPFVAHEFCHAWANPLVDAHWEALKPAGESLFRTVKDAMTKQAYTDARTMMRETLVRACVVRYVLATQGREAANEEARRQIELAFAWVPELARVLGEYEADREKYPTLEAFMPRIVATMSFCAARNVVRREKAPRVVSTVPAIGATDVDPALTKIVVTFDRPMNERGYSFVRGDGTFPEVAGGPTWDAARKVITLPVRLAPEQAYELWLNRGRFRDFQSVEGVPLESVHLTFRTGKAR